MATFNGEKYLSDQLQSFSRQTRLPDELVIFDDGSTDGTVELALNFSQKAQFEVRVFVNETNVGYSQNFSRALQNCTGDIVFLSDQDDVWLPNKIEVMASHLARDPNVLLLIHDIEYCRDDLTKIGQTKIERMQDAFDLNRKFVVGMATVIRGSFLDLCLPVPAVQGITYDSWLHDCAWTLGRKRIVHEVLALHRRHDANATKSGKLNVDYVTAPKHFRNNGRNTLDLLQMKTVLPGSQIFQLLTWLKDHRSSLIERNFVTSDCLARAIDDEVRRVESFRARSEILSISRRKRLRPVVALFSRGGYRHFSGWKSALKDLFLN